MAETDHAEFVRHLQAEKLQTQEARTRYTIQKLTYVTGLLGLGSLGIEATQLLDSRYLLLLAPWVATAHDFYIMGEDYSVKRIGAFLKAQGASETERTWETWIGRRRDPFAPWAMPLLTTLVYVGALLLSQGLGQPVTTGPLYRLWMVITPIPTWASFAFYHVLRHRLAQAWGASAPAAITGPLAALRRTVSDEDGRLTHAAVSAAARLLARTQRDPALLEVFGAEYARTEYLLNVDRDGTPVPAANETVADFRRLAEATPDFGRWFREATLSDGRATLLVARWLCHAAGFRHRTVELFLDHPALPDHTVLQVRGLQMAEAPGLFDLPAAGHVSGTESVEAAFSKELQEELGVSIGAVEQLAALGTYAYADGTNAEHRTVYRGRLSEADWLKLSAGDDELLAITCLPVHKLQSLIAAQPERVASGLRGSFGLYLAARAG
mgnify:CR=1 FL=1